MIIYVSWGFVLHRKGDVLKSGNDYRNKFKEYYGIEFGGEYHVHHIDMDRNNNDIKNLLLLPLSTHHAYHSDVPRKLTINSFISTEHYVDKEKMFSILREMKEWNKFQCFLRETRIKVFERRDESYIRSVTLPEGICINEESWDAFKNINKEDYNWSI